jgi:arylsulfatase A-like enzyme
MDMNRREFLKLTGISFLLWQTDLAGYSHQEKPNIVFLIIDELGYYELSCMGHSIMETPNIDRIADEGMRFTQMLAGAPVCAPTRL